MDNQNHEGSFKKAIGPFSGISIVAGPVYTIWAAMFWKEPE